MVVPGRPALDLQGLFPSLLRRRVVRRALFQGYSRTFREPLDRFGKREIFHLHQKVEEIATRSTTKAVESFAFRADGEGGGFFLMEGTKAFVIFPGLFQLHEIRDDLMDRQ